MDYILTCSSTLLCSLLATGCSTHRINQTHEVSMTAVSYTNAVNELLRKTEQRVIELDTNELIMAREGHSKKQKLIQKNKELDKWITLAGQLRRQNILLLKYFKALQAMVDAPLRNDMSDSLGTISQSISQVNHTEALRQGKSYRNRAFSDSQKHYISGISNLLISNHYATKVKQALRRDRLIIAKQIALQEQQLEMVSSMYKRRSRASNKDHYTNKVLAPFVSDSQHNVFVPEMWAAARLRWLENKQAETIFDGVKDANKAFQIAWADILQGKRDIGAVTADLSDVNQFVGDALNLHDSYHNPRYTGPYVGAPTITVQ